MSDTRLHLQQQMTPVASKNLSVSRGLPSRMIFFLLQEEQRFWTKNEDENSDFDNYNDVVWRIEWDFSNDITLQCVDINQTCSRRTKRDQKRDEERCIPFFIGGWYRFWSFMTIE